MAQLGDHVFDGPMTEQPAVEGGHATERAVQGAAPGGLDRTEAVPPGQQVVARRRDLRRGNWCARVDPLERSGLRIGQDSQPHRLRLPSDHGICVAQGLAEAHGDVNAPHDHRDSYRAEKRGEFIGAGGLGGEGSDADQVGAGQGLDIDRAEILVNHRDFPVGWGKTSQDQQTQWLPEPVLVQAVPPLKLAEADHGIAWVD